LASSIACLSQGFQVSATTGVQMKSRRVKSAEVPTNVKEVGSSALLVNAWKLSLRWQGEDIVGSCPAAKGGLWGQDVGHCTPYPAEESHAVRAWHAMGGEPYPSIPARLPSVLLRPPSPAPCAGAHALSWWSSGPGYVGLRRLAGERAAAGAHSRHAHTLGV